MDTHYCGGTTCHGHGEYAVCGEIYYNDIYQCSSCQINNLQDRLSAADFKIQGLEGNYNSISLTSQSTYKIMQEKIDVLTAERDQLRAQVEAQPKKADSMQTKDTVKFKIINAGMYDDTCQCTICGFIYEDRADNSFSENTENSKHACNSKSVEISVGGDDSARNVANELYDIATALHYKGDIDVANRMTALVFRLCSLAKPSPNKADVPEGWKLYKTNREALVLAKIDNNGALCWSSGWSKDSNLMLWTFLNEAFSPLPQLEESSDYDK